MTRWTTWGAWCLSMLFGAGCAGSTDPSDDPLGSNDANAPDLSGKTALIVIAPSDFQDKELLPTQAALDAARAMKVASLEEAIVRRARVMFRFKELIEQNMDELARRVTAEHGKTIDESRGETRRGIEMVEVAGKIPCIHALAVDSNALFDVHEMG